MTCSWGNSSSTVLSFLCLQKCVNDYLFIFGCLDCSLNNIFPEEGDLNILQHLTGSPCWAHGVAAAGPKASLRGDTDLQGRDRSAETQIQSEPLYWIPFFLPGTAVWITGKVPNLSHPSSRHCAPSPELLQVPLQLAGKLYQDSRDYQGNWGGSAQILLFLHNWQSAEIPVGSWWAVCTEVRCALGGSGNSGGKFSLFRIPTALVQLAGSGVSSHPQGKKRELEVCWKEWGWEGWARRGILQVPVSANTEFSLYLLQNYLWLLQIYNEVLYKLVSEKRSKRVNSVQSTRKWGHLGIYAQVDFAQRWLMSSFLYRFLHLMFFYLKYLNRSLDHPWGRGVIVGSRSLGSWGWCGTARAALSWPPPLPPCPISHTRHGWAVMARAVLHPCALFGDRTNDSLFTRKMFLQFWGKDGSTVQRSALCFTFLASRKFTADLRREAGMQSVELQG